MRKREDYKIQYYNTIMITLSLVLLFFIGAFKINIKGDEVIMYEIENQEVVKMEEVIQTNQVKIPPPPPRPQVPIEVPNEEIIEDEIIDLDADLDLDMPLDLPPPPPPSENDEDEIFVVVEQQPEIIGGMKSIYKNISYPEIARKAGIEGRVYLQFVVMENGEVSNIQVIRGIGGGCDEVAVNALTKIKFRPGMQRGRKVKVRYSLPILFKLQN